MDHEFVRAAPVRPVLERETTAAPERVHRALAKDVTGRAERFGPVTPARPLDDGAGRGIRLRGGARFRETVLVGEEPEAHATGAPGARALAEERRPAPGPGRAQGRGGRSRPTARRPSASC